jgi:hypothetical protein
MPKDKRKKRRRHNPQTAASQSPQPSKPSYRPGLPLTLAIEVPTYWTAEEALAVFELVDALHDRIWSTYRDELQELICQQRKNHTPEPFQIDDDDLPF